MCHKVHFGLPTATALNEELTEHLGARAGQTNSRAIVNVGPVQSP
jgi:hypothetical protein